MEQVIVGKIVNTHGLKGELKVKSSTDFIEERFEKGSHLFIEYQGHNIDMEVIGYRIHKGHVLVTFKDHQDINLVEKYKGCMLYADKDDSLLDDGEYYVSDLIGCEVYDQNQLIGKVKDVQLYEHHDILVVEGDKRVLIPYVDAFIESEDIELKRIDVHLIEGFYNEN
ncbi:MAG: ribosome maturation factor RimM [Coprobacillus sp.]